MNGLENPTSSEKEFLKAFFKVDDNVRDLIEGDEEDRDWLYNKILNLKTDINVFNELKTKIGNALSPLEKLLIKQDWFNWGGFLCWDYFRQEPFLLDSFHSDKPGFNKSRYRFARDLYKSKFFNKANGFQDILGLTFSRGAKSIPILLEWKRTGDSEKKNNFDKRLHYCDASSLNKLLTDEEFAETKMDLSALVNITEYETGYIDSPRFQQLADKIKEVTGIVLDKYPETLKTQIESLKESLFKSTTEELFTQEQFLNLLFWNRCFDTSWQYIFYVPGIFLNDMGVGGIVFASKELPGYTEYRLIEQSINRVFGELAIVFGSVESRLKSQAETIRAPFHEFKKIGHATKRLINKIEQHPDLLSVISDNPDFLEKFENAKFFSEYSAIAYSYFNHRKSGRWEFYDELIENDELLETGFENIGKILRLMYRPALGNALYRWQHNEKCKGFIALHRNNLINSDFNINQESQLNRFQVKGKWQTALFVGCFVLTSNMIEHGIKTMAEIGDLIDPWHEVTFYQDLEICTISFRNICSPDQVSNGLLRIKNRFESGDF